MTDVPLTLRSVGWDAYKSPLGKSQGGGAPYIGGASLAILTFQNRGHSYRPLISWERQVILARARGWGNGLVLAIRDPGSLEGRVVWSQGSREISTIVLEAHDLNQFWAHSQDDDSPL